VYGGLALPTSGACRRHKVGGHTADSTQAVLATLQLDARDTGVITAIADSSTFAPIMEAGGPWLDVYEHHSNDSYHTYDITATGDTTRVTFVARAAGSYSVVIGAAPFGNGGPLKPFFGKQLARQTVAPAPHTLPVMRGAGKLPRPGSPPRRGLAGIVKPAAWRACRSRR
jgi:hypothetical protein